MSQPFSAPLSETSKTRLSSELQTVVWFGDSDHNVADFRSEDSMPEDIAALLIGLLVIVLASSALYATTLLY